MGYCRTYIYDTKYKSISNDKNFKKNVIEEEILKISYLRYKKKISNLNFSLLFFLSSFLPPPLRKRFLFFRKKKKKREKLKTRQLNVIIASLG